MKILLFRSLWGMEGPLSEQVARIAEAGYDGVEGLPPEPARAGELKSLLEHHRLAFIAQAVTQGPDHLQTLIDQVAFAAWFKPVSITVHGGRDRMNHEEQREFFGRALDLQRAEGIPLNFETHRGRPMFTPWDTARILRWFPELRVTADFSHWCCVTETLLEECGEETALACERTGHIHARVGHPQGPQVSDPRAPEFAGTVARHEGWWDAIVKAHRNRGAERVTITPEFGPPDYMPTAPGTRIPTANLDEVCLWMKERLQTRYR